MRRLDMMRYLTVLLLIVLVGGCKNQVVQDYEVLLGETMGTYYRITCDLSPTDRGNKIRSIDLKEGVDSLLIDLNNNLSTYIPTSYISRVNTSSDGSIRDMPEQFRLNMEHCLKWYDLSGGYFDPSVMPLVNYWGFGYTLKRAVQTIDSMVIDSLMSFVGLDQWEVNLEAGNVSKTDARQQLDFSALAKGYGVDLVGDFLKSKGIDNFLVDIGGEMKAAGVSSRSLPWVVAINQPDPEAGLQDVSTLVRLDNVAMATSGNYRNFYVQNGNRYGHTINPLTGYPYQDRLLSASVITDQCMDADAIATACMAMGLEKAITFIAETENVEACLLAGTDDGTIEIIYSDGFIRYTQATEKQAY